MTDINNELDRAGVKGFGVFWRGLLMGLAEVVPGVSGGTMALVTGIYQRLIEAIASFGVGSVPLLIQPTKFYAHHKLNFLLPLVIGMAIGIILFAQLMGYLLNHYKPLVWAFFLGVIATSVFVIGRQRNVKHLCTFGVIGLALALAVMFAGQVQGTPSAWTFFLAGMLAVSAWILPAISGSYVLLLLGLYEPVLAAIRGFDVVMLLGLAAGCATGLMLFVRILEWLLKRYYEPLLALLTGFMLGSVINLWPWQVEASARLEQFVLPQEYLASTGSSPMLIMVAVSFVIGVWFLWLISKQRT